MYDCNACISSECVNIYHKQMYLQSPGGDEGCYQQDPRIQQVHDCTGYNTSLSNYTLSHLAPSVGESLQETWLSFCTLSISRWSVSSSHQQLPSSALRVLPQWVCSQLGSILPVFSHIVHSCILYVNVHPCVYIHNTYTIMYVYMYIT